MSRVDLQRVVAEAAMQARWEAANELHRAQDRLCLLEYCERVTGRAFVTTADVESVKDAAARFTMVSPGKTGTREHHRARHRLQRRRKP